MSKQNNIIDVKINAKLWESLEGTELDLGGYTRATEMTEQGSANYKEAPAPGMVKFKIPYTADTDLEELRNAVGVTVTAETDIGQDWLMTDAHITNTLKPSGGEVEIVVEGPAFKRI